MSYRRRLADAVQSAGVGVFGEPVTFTPDGGTAVAIRGVFDAAFVSVDVDAGVPISSVGPALRVRLADLEALPAQGDRYVVHEIGRELQVDDVQEDGAGGALLLSSYTDE